MMNMIILLALCAVFQQSLGINETMMYDYTNVADPMLPEQTIKQRTHMMTLGESAAGGMIPTAITIILVVCIRIIRVRQQRRRLQQNTIMNDVMHALTDNGICAAPPSSEPTHSANSVIRTECTEANHHLDNSPQ